MDDKGRPFMVGGNLSTIKSKESYCRITCPGCSFKFYAFHISGSCMSIICTECLISFMGVVDTVDCGECEERLKCFGMRPVKFELVPRDEEHRMTPERVIMPKGFYEELSKNLPPSIFGLRSKK